MTRVFPLGVKTQTPHCCKFVHNHPPLHNATFSSGYLKSITVWGTNFSGLIPSSISNLKPLSRIDLSSCKFTGPIPSTFANLTEMTFVDLSHNLFTGSLYSTLFGGLPNLVTLNLRSNSFTGQVEEFTIVNVSNIAYLDLSSNRLEGPIPKSLFQLQSLRYLTLSHNSFSGNFQLEKIQSLQNLEALELSHNNSSVDTSNINSTSYEFPKLKVLGLASCNLREFPEIIKHSDMNILDLSNNKIAGEIPSWIWGIGQPYIFNFSCNLLRGLEKPYHIPASLYRLELQSNQMEEEVQLTHPLLSSNYLLPFDNNSLSGSVPTTV